MYGQVKQRGVLLGLAIGDMPPDERVVAPLLQAIRVVLAILCGCIGVPALAAAQLDNNAVALLGRHRRNSLDMSARAQRPDEHVYRPVIVTTNRRKDKRS